MFDENQLVEMQWNNGSKSWYESKGYIFTKPKDIFYVKAKDLKPSSNKVIDVVCDYCGKRFNKNYYWLNKSRERGENDCCSDCKGKKVNEITLEKRAKEHFGNIEIFCRKLDYKLVTTINEYSNVFMKIKYICPKHGLQETELRILEMGCGCPECGKEKISKALILDVDNVRNIIESVDGNVWLNPDEYMGVAVNNLKIKCKCGNMYTTSLSSYVHYNVTRCPSCSNKESKSETYIKNFLVNHNINFKQEKSFKDCKDINALPFDFYLPDYNCCIEYNGKQHYEPIDYFGGKERFEIQKKHDKMKKEYCEKNNIKFICIPYWDENNIEEILTKQLNL